MCKSTLRIWIRFCRRNSPRRIFPLCKTAAALARSKSSLRVAGVVALDTARQQTFAAALPALRECRSAAVRLHAGAETVLAFARALGWLVGTFHKAAETARRDLKAITLGMSTALSIALGSAAQEGCLPATACRATASSSPFCRSSTPLTTRLVFRGLPRAAIFGITKGA